MDRAERAGDHEEALRLALDGRQAGLWTALPGVIKNFNPSAMTCEVQPAINGFARQPDGSLQVIQMPLLLDCPVYFPAGGGCTLTFPIASGDECLVVFASRCIDSWWQLGGIQGQAEIRMHDLSDGFVFAGVRSQPRVLPGLSASAVQLRSDDGSTYFALTPSTGEIKLVAPGGFDVIAPLTTFSGAVKVNGVFTFVAGMVGSALSGAAAVFTGILNVVGQITANGKRVDDTHSHSGVQHGTDNSGPVA